MFELGYVGNLGRHQVIPVPFNQPNIASPHHPINGEHYSYGYNVQGANLPDGTGYDYDYEGGNIDHRVPYIGYAAESIDYKAAGVDAYNALTAHLEKRMSHGFQIAASYTYSHALDEQSGLGLFYNGNNPLNLRDGYASSDFDRTHVLNFNYVYRLPDFVHKHTVAGYFANGWSLVGLTILQSGQPYSVIDFSGAVGSIYYGVQQRHHEPDRPAGARLYGEEREDRAFRRVWRRSPEVLLLHDSVTRSRRAERSGADLRSLREHLHDWSAQHLPSGVSKALRCFAGEA